jgi:P-type conjugative transfer protein TrbG
MKEKTMNRIPHLIYVLPICSLALSACATADSEHPAPTFKKAVVLPDPPQPEKIVAVAQPLSLPGQLQPPPKPAQPETAPPQSRVNTANRRALQEPASSGYINAIQVYPYTEGALYRLYAAPQEVSDIALQPGETLVAISAGDTVRWVVGDTTSGVGATKQVHVLAKPFAAGLKTNLVITTDRRSYHLQLESTDHTYMAALSWTYPDDELIALKEKSEAAQAAAPIDTGLSLDNLNFQYRITGDDAPWKPLRAFDDGRKVYVEFGTSLAQGDAPPLFVLGAQGSSDLVNYRVRGNYYIVDQLFGAAELRFGQDKQQIVRITREDGKQAHSARNDLPDYARSAP